MNTNNEKKSQNQLLSLLRKKGIGKTMGKHLSEDECNLFLSLIDDESVSLTTIATLCIAFVMLPSTDIEHLYKEKLKQKLDEFFPALSLLLFVFSNNQSIKNGNCNIDGVEFSEKMVGFLALIQQLIKYENLSDDEMSLGMTLVLNTDIESWAKAMFLEGLRLKRETKEENIAGLHTFFSFSKYEKLSVPVVIDIANAYDGFTRTPNYSLFSATILGAMGISCIVHGSFDVSPKYGVTAHKILIDAKKNPLLTMKKVKSFLEDPSVGWGYIDLDTFFPELAALFELRKNMLKRPLLATLEKCLLPFRAKQTVFVTGYTHPPYKEMMANILDSVDCSGYTVFRGVEGAAQLALDRKAPYILDNRKEGFVRPEDYLKEEHISLIGNNSKKEMSHEGLSISEMCCYSLTQGLAALSGEKNEARLIIEYQVSSILDLNGLMERSRISKCIEDVISSGKALGHWNRGQHQ